MLIDCRQPAQLARLFLSNLRENMPRAVAHRAPRHDSTHLDRRQHRLATSHTTSRSSAADATSAANSTSNANGRQP